MKIIRKCSDCGFFKITHTTSYLFRGAAICTYKSRKLKSLYNIPSWCPLENIPNQLERKNSMENFASYEKEIDSVVTRIKHTVRILINSNREAIEEALKNVPYTAKVYMVIDDTELENCGEIVFFEDKVV